MREDRVTTPLSTHIDQGLFSEAKPATETEAVVKVMQLRALKRAADLDESTHAMREEN